MLDGADSCFLETVYSRICNHSLHNLLAESVTEPCFVAVFFIFLPAAEVLFVAADKKMCQAERKYAKSGGGGFQGGEAGGGREIFMKETYSELFSKKKINQKITSWVQNS
jgi:hypothetical protein